MDIRETKRPLKHRGFYVRMKLSRSNRNADKNLCYRYLKWVVWLSISFYFISSFLITGHKPTTSFSRTTVSRSKASRALIEEESSFNSPPLIKNLQGNFQTFDFLPFPCLPEIELNFLFLKFVDRFGSVEGDESLCVRFAVEIQQRLAIKRAV